MANTYTWLITALDCIPNVDGKTDYVVVAHWTCSGTDGTYTGVVYNTATFTVDPTKADYVPYDQLTEAEVVLWVQESLGNDTEQAVYRSIDTQIEGQANPTIVTPPLPWQTAPSNN